MWPNDVVGTLDQQLSQVPVTGFCDSKLRVTVAGLAAPRPQAEIAADIATAHVAVGAIMLSFGVSISAICWRISKINFGRARQSQSRSDPGAPHSEPVAA